MKKVILQILLILIGIPAIAQVRLAQIFTDNMVLQAHKPIKIWGSASSKERVKVILNDNSKNVTADKKGNWEVTFPAMDYSKNAVLKVIGKNNTINLSNVLIGEVWLCSGQSNMAMTVSGVNNFKNEEGNANYPLIRSFNVKPNYSVNTGVDVEGEWEVCSPQTVSTFSAVAYFFARKIYQETGVPIGIINSSWGGTDIETWISSDAFRTLPEIFKTRYNTAETVGIESVLKKNEENKNALTKAVSNDIGIDEKWYDFSFNPTAWHEMLQPQEWATTELAAFDGVAWFKKEVNLLENEAGKTGILSLGKVDDNETTWINGVKIGETDGAGNDRVYEIPSGILKKGKNIVTVRIVDAMRAGGFTSAKEDLFLKIGESKYSLAGNWSYKTTVDIKDLHYEDNVPNLYYGLLYNGMIDPIKDFEIKGVIWYQGENNAGQAYNYRTLFPCLINDWRSKWGYDFPFYWVQLASYLAKSEEPPTYDSWAELREAQTLTLSVNYTGQAITTDIGDANDIHPKNKQDVGYRLALIALNKDYNKTDVVYSGPTYKSMSKENGRIVIEFYNVASGLKTKSKYGYVEGFSIAGDDQKFVWANAKIDGNNRIIVYSDKVKNPVAVRYCWAINPDVNLYNDAELPAAPFRTDTWKLGSQN